MDNSDIQFLVDSIAKTVDRVNTELTEIFEMPDDRYKITRLLEQTGALQGSLLFIGHELKDELNRPKKKFWQFWK
jgi:hypothetical protein